ncbi:MAG: hypothetical protein ACREGH_02530 [Minisyncoccia bacterium]
MWKVFECMAKIGMPLCIRGEMVHHNGKEVDIFYREKVFIEQVLDPLRCRLPKLKIVIVNISTEVAARYVLDAYNRNHACGKPCTLAGTITPHHLVLNRNRLFGYGMRSRLYCLPIPNTEEDQQALRKAATSGLPCFFLGSDPAPYPTDFDQGLCGCDGVFNAPTALATYAEVFEKEGELDNLEPFASLHGPDFLGLEPDPRSIALVKKPWCQPAKIEVTALTPSFSRPCYIDRSVPVFRGGEQLEWAIAA